MAARLGISPAELEASLAAARPLVYQARLRRVPPGLDDKVLTAWNGLMISALAEGHRVLGDPRYLAAAARAADFLLAKLRAADGRLLRTYRAGTAHLAAYLEDYAYLADALIDLYEAGAPARFLREAEALATRMRADFADAAGGFFSTARDHEPLIVRHREGHDGATPVRERGGRARAGPPVVPPRPRRPPRGGGQGGPRLRTRDRPPAPGVSP